MQNNPSKLNTALLIIVIILLAVGTWAILNKNKSSEPMDYNFPTSDELNQKQESTTNVQKNNIQVPAQGTVPKITWVKSSANGLYYPEGAIIKEDIYLNPAQEASGGTIGMPYLWITYNNTSIQWGGAQSGCIDNEFGVFQYGVSTTACVKSLRADVGQKNITPGIGETLTVESKKIFGDFVVKNNKTASAPVVTTNSEVRFSGTVESYNTGCYVDAVCSITISGKKVITTIGWTGGPVGQVKGVRGLNEVKDKIGHTANVYAKKDNGEYTLYGSENYYIEIK